MNIDDYIKECLDDDLLEQKENISGKVSIDTLLLMQIIRLLMQITRDKLKKEL